MNALLDSVGYDAWVLHALVWLPVLGMGLVLWSDEERAKKVAFWWSLGVLVLSLGLWWAFDATEAGFQMTSTTPWIESWGVSYSLGLDGISLFMVILTTLSTSLAILGSFNYIQTRQRAFYALMLLLEAGVVGVFVATDVLLFYVFFELTLVPMYFIVGVWGGERRIYAAIKFFLFTALGSLLMLVGILYLFWRAKNLLGAPTFAYSDFLLIPLSGTEQLWLFIAFALAFSVKVPVFPLHTWLPDAHVEAPTAGSVILAAVLLKMGTYGFLRFAMALFPVAAADWTPLIAVLAVIGIIYGALVAMVQKDVKKLVAYSSVSHLGFVMLGLFAFNLQGIEGAILQMVNHGISTGALFLIVGIIYERRHTRLISEFGGLSKVVPVFSLCFMVVTLSSIGVPGTNGFVGEFLILLGAFKVQKWYAVVAATGVIFAAVYMLWMFQRVMYGKITNEENLRLADMNGREVAYMLPLLLFILWIGVYPQPFLRRMDASVNAFVTRFEAKKQAALAGSPAGETMLVRYFDGKKGGAR